ncbi:MAG: WecB/TagA/CpsF family glycosyltransferase [Pseudomonadales bacterium]|nr:WecB/TagA/CpsF family glycosyltransferase [Pseudomonadales bacterium]
MKRIKLENINFLIGTRSSVTEFISRKISRKEKFTLLPISLNDLASIEENVSLQKDYRSIDFCVTDGMPLVWFFSLKNKWRNMLKKSQRVERVYGPNLTKDILAMSDKKIRHLFYGSSQSTLDKLSINVKKINPNLTVLGMISPPFRDLTLVEEANYIADIIKHKIDVLWIGLSSPKQVKLASRWSKLLPATSILCVGAAFDFLADKQPMAPAMVQSMGLEWLFRLLVSPLRLWRRYLILIPKYLIKRIYLFFFN